jgi:hypothetical protein
MALFRSSKGKLRSGDAAQSADSEPGPVTPPTGGEQAPVEVPAPELPPAEIATDEVSPVDAAADQGEPEEKAETDRGRGSGKEKKPRQPVANLSRVRRERRALMREREARIRDLGGLMLEMYRRDQFREDLIVEHCAQAMGIENRIHELETILLRARSGRVTPGPQCACGAPLLFGARFCANCGRPTDLAGAGEKCAYCGQTLSSGAEFCASCGAAVDNRASGVNESEQTMEHSPGAEPGGAAEQTGGGEA